MRLLWFTLAVLSLGCGDALTERGFLGVPLYTFTGRIASVGGPRGYEGPLRAALFWSPDGDTAITSKLVEQQDISMEVRFPGEFEINVFAPPPETAWAEIGAAYRVGLILIYEDLDRDGRFDLGELRGGAQNQALLFVERALDAEGSPTGRALSPGFTAQRLPMACHEPESERAPDCGVPLGATCSVDADCGVEGLCVLQDRHGYWSGGYCVQPHVRGSCVPAGAVKLLSDARGAEAYFWHLACETSADCRQEEGYACDQAHLACLPGEAVALILDPALIIADLCGPDGESSEDDDDDD